MTLEFGKVQSQVDRMGRAFAQMNLDESERVRIALRLLDEKAGDLDAIHDRIQLARERDAGFRGAAPPDSHLGIREPVNQAYDLPPVPARATLIAADGSQIYPSTHAAALYYLTNIGLFVYHHGGEDLPEQFTEPRLHYAETDMRDQYGQVITNDAVNARRNVLEMLSLARAAWECRDINAPLIAMRDGQLLFWVGKDVPDRERLEAEYLGSLVSLYDVHADMQGHLGQPASLIGYVDRPSSTFIMSLLHLLDLDEMDVRAAHLKSNGELEGLPDQALLFRFLAPGQRTALLVQQSPQNKRYHDKGENYEIAFFYLNVGVPGDYKFARVEMPVWVARQPDRVNLIHALLYDQCQIMWRYPYALARADELAVVRGQERQQLEDMIKQSLLSNAQTVEESEKLSAKSIRHGRTRYGQKRR